MNQSAQDFLKLAGPKVLCVGKNYIKHIIQMGGTQTLKQPLIFIKPWSSILYNPSQLPLPIAKKHKIDHEIQLGFWISKPGSNITKSYAMDHVGGYFIAIDVTDRDFQKQAKQKGHPWTLAKCQDKFCIVSPSVKQLIDPYQIQLHLKVNNITKQKDKAGQMQFKIPDIISYTSDLFLTGTPPGVGPMQIGDHIQATASINGKIITSLQFHVV